MIQAGEAGLGKGNCSVAMVDALSEVGNVSRRVYRDAQRCFLEGDSNSDTSARLFREAFQVAGIPIDLGMTMSGTCVTSDHLKEDFFRAQEKNAQEKNAFFAVRINARAIDMPHIWGVESVEANRVTVVGVCEEGRTRQNMPIKRLLKRMRKVTEKGEKNAYIFTRE